jgi:hypothetical protein
MTQIETAKDLKNLPKGGQVRKALNFAPFAVREKAQKVTVFSI